MNEQEQKLYPIGFSDTTLRDGEQMPGASLTPDQKLEIARALARVGVQSLDAGFPASSQSEIEALQRIVAEVKGPVISALCRAIPGDIDAAYEALKAADPRKRAASIFVATSPVHREDKLRKSKTELLDLIGESIQYALLKFPIVAFSPEDASRTEMDFLCEVYRIAIEAGARTIGFPDTIGILTPEKVRHFIRTIRDRVPNLDNAYIAVHFHNDLGLAVANTLAAVAEGVHIVQCAVNGIGERAGNAALEEVAIALLANQEQYRRQVPLDPQQLLGLSQLVARLTEIPLAPNKAVVGENIFATEAGIHQDGLLKNPDTYLPFRPELVGAEGVRLVLGKHSGRAAIANRLQELGYHLDAAQLEGLIASLKSASKAQWRQSDRLLTETVARLFPETVPMGAQAAVG